MSPYNVAYPTASSDLFPVETTSQPCVFESAMRTTPRARACRFSAATPSRPPAASSYDATIDSISISRNEQPRFSASRPASARVSSDE
jgi:hypothetical protein